MWRHVDIVDRLFGGTYPLHIQGRRKKKRKFETSVYTISTLRHIPKDGILHSHRLENLIFYIMNISSPGVPLIVTDDLYADVISARDVMGRRNSLQ
jgi:hypothetical protein